MMKMSAILVAALIVSPPLVYAAENPVTAPKTVEHGGHDPAASAGANGMGGMGRPTAWTALPILKTKMSGEDRESRVITIVPQNIVAGSIDAYSNNLKDEKAHRQLQMDMAGARLDKPATGGFQILAAREERDGKVRVASTVYFFSERGGQNPTAMFMQQKHELEIIPQPFPREHSRYRANEDWKFLVRFNSKPLAGQKVNLETRNGTKTELLSDAQGVITVHVPDDFKVEAEKKNAAGHSHERRSSDFVLAAELAEGGKTYLTAFNGSYGPDAFDQRSMAMGLGFTLMGMMGAAPLLRQRKAAKKPSDAGQATDVHAARDTNKNGEA